MYVLACYVAPGGCVGDQGELSRRPGSMGLNLQRTREGEREGEREPQGGREGERECDCEGREYVLAGNVGPSASSFLRL